MKTRFIDKLIERMERIDPDRLQTQFLRLAREKGLMETILEAILEGIIVLDELGRLTYANRAAQKILGFSIEEAEGNLISRYLEEIQWDKIIDLDEHEWSRMVSREIEITYPEHRFLQFYVVPLSVVQDGEEGAVLILRDVTRERETVAQNLESERLHAITLLAAGVAHEIGNPLNSLNIHLQLLERQIANARGDQQQRLSELVGIAKQEVGRLDGILNRFLRALRPEPPQTESSQIEGILGKALEFMRDEIEQRDVRIQVEIPEMVPSVQVDPAQIKQTFFNVIKNAIQAMTQGGVLHIELKTTDRFVAIAFSDTGPGIPPDELGRIFEPYYSSKADGSGLGLMIVQRIMRDHGGEIEVYSEPGHGSMITLFFPREDQRVRLLEAHDDRVEKEPKR